MAAAAVSNAVVRVLIADDDPDIRVLLRSLLSLDQRIEVVGEATDGGEAADLFDALRPDVLVLDERMPVLYGLEVAERVLAEHPTQVVILCTAFVDDTMTARATELGVRGVFGKGEIQGLSEEILRITR